MDFEGEGVMGAHSANVSLVHCVRLKYHSFVTKRFLCSLGSSSSSASHAGVDFHGYLSFIISSKVPSMNAGNRRMWDVLWEVR